MAIKGARPEDGRVTPHLMVRGGRKAIAFSAMARSVYAVHPGVAMVQNAIAGLPGKTGRSLDEWVALIRTHGPKGEPARKAWLKTAHGLGTNYAGWLAAAADGKGETGSADAYLETAERYVEEMYAGARTALRPLYEALLTRGLSIGADVKACPCKTIVPLYRNHVFAQIKPTTQTRIDFGLALGDTKKTPKRLIDTGGFAKKDRITHRFEITSLKDIDDEVKRWLKTAYDRDESGCQKPDLREGSRSIERDLLESCPP